MVPLWTMVGVTSLINVLDVFVSLIDISQIEKLENFLKIFVLLRMILGDNSLN